jgi:hypothetical protein
MKMIALLWEIIILLLRKGLAAFSLFLPAV